ncbi:uncharacterized protein LOC131601835 [Vicia villosa]|uniref:uncharacterized protein LOC131601835 n=1 Tax=Vicia villosa TaxID=3911 RepID=UPI00273B4E4B|nr:uncharacterized protein LOC131601835 [Vicia villosa]
MKRNCVKVSQESLSQTDLYLLAECWEFIFKLVNCDDEYFKCLSLVSKQFLSITDGFRFSLTVHQRTLPFLPRLVQRFTNLTSVNFSLVSCDLLDKLLPQISHFPLKITSLNISNRPSFPEHGLRAFSKNVITLSSLICSNVYFDYKYDFFHIAHLFPLLQILDLSFIGRLHLFHSPRMKLHGMMNFELPRLEVLDLSNTTVDDEELYIISKACHGLLQLSLNTCRQVTEKGVKHVLQNCTQLREIDMEWCRRVRPKIVLSMVFSRPSLRKITAPPGCILSHTEKELLKLQGCIVSSCFEHAEWEIKNSSVFFQKAKDSAPCKEISSLQGLSERKCMQIRSGFQELLTLSSEVV